MITDILIKIWKRNGITDEEISKRLEAEGSNKVLIKQGNGEKQTRNRKKEFTQAISLKLDDFLAERLDRYVNQQLLYPPKSKGVIYRHIFEDFLKRAYDEYDFDWNEGNLMETENKTMEEQR